MATQELKLYDDQQTSLDALREGFRAGHRAQMLYAACGWGKTEMSIALMAATARKEKRSAMILDRIVLCNQTSERLSKYGIDHGVLQSGHWRYRPYERIQVCSAQTLEKRGSFPGLNLMIVDEAHCQRKKTTNFIKNNPDVKVIGLSASPFTKGLADTYTNVVCATTTERLVASGRLVPLKVFIAKQIDMKGSKKVAGEFATDEAATRGMKITGDIVSEWIKKTHDVFGGPVKTIAFCANVAHGADMAQKFAESGFNFVPISYLTDEEVKKEALADFAKADTKIDGLIACDILTKGFDCPSVRCMISARPFSKSFSQWVQQLGRGMRADPFDATKTFCLLLDHANNFLRFQEDWEDLYHDGVAELKGDGEKAKKEVSDKELEERRCPKCSSLWPSKSDTCPNCGFTRPRLNLVETVEGEMVELGAGASRDTKQAWWSQIMAAGEAKGYSRGWMSNKYREKFGVWPRGLNDAPAPVTAEVGKWILSRQIAWARSQANRRA